MHRLDLLIPPPLVAVLFAVAIWALSVVLPVTWTWPGQAVSAAAFALGGVTLDVVSVIGFFRAKTTINPLKPEASAVLVTTGFYRFTRNPMYLGMAMILLGWTLYHGTPLGLFVWFGFVAYITRFQILPEERRLKDLFGANYAAYCERVRRWI